MSSPDDPKPDDSKPAESKPAESKPTWPEQWAVQAAVDAERIRNRLNAATARRLSGPEAASRAAVECHLRQAERACCRDDDRKRRSRMDKWRGTSVEQAFLHLHAAKGFLIDLLPPADVEALVPDVTTRLATALDRNDPRRGRSTSGSRAGRSPPRSAARRSAGTC
jgi:hypothetical protein